MRSSQDWMLAAAVGLAAIVACGPGDGGAGPAPQVPGTGTAPAATATTAPAPTATATTPAPAPTGTTATQVPPPKGAMKPVAPSAMVAKLREIGLDPAALPPLNKLEPKMLRDVMNTFTKSLGVQCSHCHEKDFKAPTAKKKIATHMWNDFARGLAIAGGAAAGGPTAGVAIDRGTLYCDSCHGGRAQFLDRSDLKALGAWMQENYVDKLKRVDKKDHECSTCHGDPFEGKILTKKWL